MLQAYSLCSETTVAPVHTQEELSGPDSASLDYEDIRVRSFEAPKVPSADTFIQRQKQGEEPENEHHETERHYIIFNETRTVVTKDLPFQEQSHWPYQTDRLVTSSFLFDHVIISLKGPKYVYLREVATGLTWLCKLPRNSKIRTKVRRQYSMLARGEIQEMSDLGVRFDVTSNIEWLLVFDGQECWMAHLSESKTHQRHLIARWTRVQAPVTDSYDGSESMQYTCIAASFDKSEEDQDFETHAAVVWLWQQEEAYACTMSAHMQLSIDENQHVECCWLQSITHRFPGVAFNVCGSSSSLACGVHAWSGHDQRSRQPLLILWHLTSSLCFTIPLANYYPELQCGCRQLVLHSRGSVVVLMFEDGSRALFSSAGLQIALCLLRPTVPVAYRQFMYSGFSSSSCIFITHDSTTGCLESLLCGFPKATRAKHRVTREASMTALRQLLPHACRYFTPSSGCLFVEPWYTSLVSQSPSQWYSASIPLMLPSESMECHSLRFEQVNESSLKAVDCLLRAISCLGFCLNTGHRGLTSHEEESALLRQELRSVMSSITKAVSKVVNLASSGNRREGRVSVWLQDALSRVASDFGRYLKRRSAPWRNSGIGNNQWVTRTFVKQFINDLVEFGLKLCQQYQYSEDHVYAKPSLQFRLELVISTAVGALRMLELVSVSTEELSHSRNHFFRACRELQWEDIAVLVFPQAFQRDWIHLSLLVVKAARTISVEDNKTSEHLAGIASCIASNARYQLSESQNEAPPSSLGTMGRIREALKLYAKNKFQMAFSTFCSGGIICYPMAAVCSLINGRISETLRIASTAVAYLRDFAATPFDDPAQNLRVEASKLTCKIIGQYLLIGGYRHLLRGLVEVASLRKENCFVSVSPIGLLQDVPGDLGPAASENGFVLPHPSSLASFLNIYEGSDIKQYTSVISAELLPSGVAELATRFYAEAGEYTLSSVVAAFSIMSKPEISARRKLLAFAKESVLLRTLHELFRSFLMESKSSAFLGSILNDTNDVLPERVLLDLKRRCLLDTILFDRKCRMEKPMLIKPYQSSDNLVAEGFRALQLNIHWIYSSGTNQMTMSRQSALSDVHALLQEICKHFRDSLSLRRVSRHQSKQLSSVISRLPRHAVTEKPKSSEDDGSHILHDDVHASLECLARYETKEHIIKDLRAASERGLHAVIFLARMYKQTYYDCINILSLLWDVTMLDQCPLNIAGAMVLMKQYCASRMELGTSGYIPKINALLREAFDSLFQCVAWDVLGYLQYGVNFQKDLCQNGAAPRFAFFEEYTLPHSAVAIIVDLIAQAVSMSSIASFDLLVVFGVYGASESINALRPHNTKRLRQLERQLRHAYGHRFWLNVEEAISRLVWCSQSGVYSTSGYLSYLETQLTNVIRRASGSGDCSLLSILTELHSVFHGYLHSHVVPNGTYFDEPLLCRWIHASLHGIPEHAHSFATRSETTNELTRVVTSSSISPEEAFESVQHVPSFQSTASIPDSDDAVLHEHETDVPQVLPAHDDGYRPSTRSEFYMFRNALMNTSSVMSDDENLHELVLGDLPLPESASVPTSGDVSEVPHYEGLARRFYNNQNQLSSLIESGMNSVAQAARCGSKLVGTRHAMPLMHEQGPQVRIEPSSSWSSAPPREANPAELTTGESPMDRKVPNSIATETSGAVQPKSDQIETVQIFTDYDESYRQRDKSLSEHMEATYPSPTDDEADSFNAMLNDDHSSYLKFQQSKKDRVPRQPIKPKKLLTLDQKGGSMERRTFSRSLSLRQPLGPCSTPRASTDGSNRETGVPVEQSYTIAYGKYKTRGKKPRMLRKYLDYLTKLLEQYIPHNDPEQGEKAKSAMMEELGFLRRKVEEHQRLSPKKHQRVAWHTSYSNARQKMVSQHTYSADEPSLEACVEEIPFESDEDSDHFPTEAPSDDPPAANTDQKTIPSDFAENRFDAIRNSIAQLEQEITALERGQSDSSVLLKRLDAWAYHTVKESQYRGLQYSVSKCINAQSDLCPTKASPASSSAGTFAAIPQSSRKTVEARAAVDDAWRLFNQFSRNQTDSVHARCSPEKVSSASTRRRRHG
eukprot:gb/GECG01008995.1/.p1 GENE.gb/GECG01008995.1/~~gb/GECG01008995.1/.p1  ORF type:complete len:2066 (+),score=202.97 gb/GECG01008995.1/:1-6198(+)